MLRRLASSLCLVMLAQSPALAETYALVVGADKYPFESNLDGARKDAEDVAAALRNVGVPDIRVFLDEQVKKADIRAAWLDLVAKAGAGDTILFTYAGHGSQMPEVVPGDEEDKLDEFLQLPGFDRNNAEATVGEAIIDNELSKWFEEAENRGVYVLFVSDSCHSGGMSRTFSGKMRLAPAVKVSLPPPTPEAIEGARVQDSKFLQVTVLAASLESQPTPEVIIQGEARGALSWSFARALEGKADKNKDGQISRIELEDYVFSNVKSQSEALQVPNFTPQVPRSSDEVVFSLTRSIIAPVIDVKKQEPSDPQQVVVVQPDPVEIQKPEPDPVVVPEPEPEPVVPEPEPAVQTEPRKAWSDTLALEVTGSDIVPEHIGGNGVPYRWDASAGTFTTPNGDLAGENIGPDLIQGVVDKFILLDFLKAMASANPSSVSLTPVQELYTGGDIISFDAPATGYDNMLVFNLANTGQIQPLDLQVKGARSQEFALKDLEVVEPFGADHLIVISTNQPVDAIGAALNSPDITPAALLGLLSARLEGTPDTSVAIQPLYTRKN